MILSERHLAVSFIILVNIGRILGEYSPVDITDVLDRLGQNAQQLPGFSRDSECLD